MNGAIARIILRYLVGGTFFETWLGNAELAAQIALDPDWLMVVSALVAAAIEAYYKLAKKHGWPT